MSNSSKHIHIVRGFPSTFQCSVCFGAFFSIPYRNTQGKSWELFGRHPKSVDGLWDSHASTTRNFKEQWRRPPSFQITSLLITSAWVISQKSDFVRLGIFRSDSKNLLTLHIKTWDISPDRGLQDVCPNTPTYRCSNASQRDLRCIAAPRARPVPYNFAAELVTNAPRQSSNPTYGWLWLGVDEFWVAMFQGGHIEEMICMFRCYCEVINKDQQSMQKI